LQKRNSYISKNNIITLLCHIVIFYCSFGFKLSILFSLIQFIFKFWMALPNFIDFLFLWFNYIVSNLKNSSLVFQIFKYFCVHLQIHFEDFPKHWIQTVIKHSGLISRQIILMGNVDINRLLDALLLELIYLWWYVKFIHKLLVFFKNWALDDQI